jgi:hypothetical protein
MVSSREEDDSKRIPERVGGAIHLVIEQPGRYQLSLYL